MVRCCRNTELAAREAGWPVGEGLAVDVRTVHEVCCVFSPLNDELDT